MVQAFIRITLGIYFCFSISSCYKSNQSPDVKTEAKPTAQTEGSSTGGGSFADESSLTILRWASEDLARQIANSSPEIYMSLPNGWTQQKLVDVIRNVKPSVDSSDDYLIPEVSRYGRRLMFNYIQKADGTYFITATRQFLDSFSHFEVNTRPKHEFLSTLEEVKLKLIHETAHLMGLGLNQITDMTEARSFAKALLATLDSDNIECVPTSAPPIQIYAPNENIGLPTLDSRWTKEELERRTDEYFSKRSKAFVINRPSGRSAVPTNGRRTLPRDLSISNASTEVLDVSSGYIYVFAPKSYDGKFSFPTIVKSIKTGARDYGYPDGYFSWNLVDLRKAVLTDEGYKSNFDYRSEQMNANFHDYLDFRVIKNSVSSYEIETYPPLQQENWDYYRSQGKARIEIKFMDAKIVDSKLIILKDFNEWLDGRPSKDLNLEVPLTCVRSFKPLGPSK